MNPIKRIIGIIMGIIMLLSVFSSIKIGTNIFLGQKALAFIGIPYNKFVVAGIFIATWFVWSKIMKEEHAIWINWGRILISLFFLVAVASYILIK